MENSRKRNIVTKARLVYGLVEVLKDDISRTKTHAMMYDFVGLTKSLKEVKETVQVLRDTLAEFEYELYLLEQETGEDAS